MVNLLYIRRKKKPFKLEERFNDKEGCVLPLSGVKGYKNHFANSRTKMQIDTSSMTIAPKILFFQSFFFICEKKRKKKENQSKIVLFCWS